MRYTADQKTYKATRTEKYQPQIKKQIGKKDDQEIKVNANRKEEANK